MPQLKDVSLWDEEFIRTLPAEEFDWLEYKASNKFASPNWLMDLSKYVSAWANYDGGYIIFGVNDPSPGSPLMIDGGVPESIKPNITNWLDDIVPGLVEMPIRTFATHVITPQSEKSQIKPGHAVIVIHIPESEIAPHQAQDHKYYQRSGRRLEPIKHRAVLDILSRKKYPKLRTTIIVHGGGKHGSRLFWKINNIGTVMAKDWKVVIRFPTRIGKTEIMIPNEKVTSDCTEVGESFLEIKIIRRMGSPLFPQSDISRTFEIHPCHYDPPNEPSIEYVRVTTFADEMPMVEEVFQLSDVLRQH